MLYIAICDKQEECVHTASQIHDIISEMGLQCSVKTFHTGDDLLEYTENSCPFHIIFMDVALDKKNGIQTAAELRRNNYKNYIVFLSETAKYALDSYQVKACGYLLKPLSNDLLKDTLESICQELQEKSSAVIPINTKSGMYMIRQRDILYMESQNHSLILHCKNTDPLTFNGKLDNIKQNMPVAVSSCFLRCHKSYVVNCEYVQKIEPTCFRLVDGTQVPISRSYKNMAIPYYMSYINV